MDSAQLPDPTPVRQMKIVEQTHRAVTMASALLQGVKYRVLARRTIKYGKLRC